MSGGEFTLLVVCCIWPLVGGLVGWGLRGAVERRKAVVVEQES